MSDLNKKLLQVASGRSGIGNIFPNRLPRIKKQMLDAACARMLLGKIGRQFSDKDILGIQWFAHLPVAFRRVENFDVSGCVFDESNLLASRFWAVYLRNPSDTLKAVEKSRKELAEFMSEAPVNPVSAAKSVLLNLEPNTTVKEAAFMACELAGLKSNSIAAMEKTIRRIIANMKPKRTKTASNLSA